MKNRLVQHDNWKTPNEVYDKLNAEFKFDFDFAIRQKEQELGISRNELINDALWTVFCNTKKFYEYEMQRHLMNAEVYRHKLEANRLSKEVKL